MLTLSQVVTWLKGVELYSKGDYSPALKQFNQLLTSPEYSGEVSKVAHNIAAIYYKMDDHERATKWFITALQKDPYLCITHFLFGQLLFDQEKYAEAAKEWDKCLEYMRGNTWINYGPLGLSYTLYSCEVMFNKAMACIYSGEILSGVQDLSRAGREHKWTNDHKRIDKAFVYFNAIKDSLHRATHAPPKPERDMARSQSLSRSNTLSRSKSNGKALMRNKSVKHQQLQDTIRNRSSMGFGANYTNTFGVAEKPQPATGLGIRESPNLSRSQTLGARDNAGAHAGPRSQNHSAPLARSQSTRAPTSAGSNSTTTTSTNDTVDLPSTVKMARSSPTYAIFQIASEFCLFSIHDNRLKNIVGCEQMAALLRGKDKEISSGGAATTKTESAPQVAPQGVPQRAPSVADDSTEFSFIESASSGRSSYDIDEYYRGQRSSQESNQKKSSARRVPVSPPDDQLSKDLRKVSFDSSVDSSTDESVVSSFGSPMQVPKLNKLVDSIHGLSRDSLSSNDSNHQPKATRHKVQLKHIRPQTAKVCSFVAEEVSSPDTPTMATHGYPGNGQPTSQPHANPYGTHSGTPNGNPHGRFGNRFGNTAIRSPYPHDALPPSPYGHDDTPTASPHLWDNSQYEDESYTWSQTTPHLTSSADMSLLRKREKDRREIMDGGLMDDDHVTLSPTHGHEFDPQHNLPTRTRSGRIRNQKFLTVQVGENEVGPGGHSGHPAGAGRGRSKSPGSPMSPFILVT